MEEILNRLYSYGKFGIKLGLQNIEEILKLLGNPQESYKIVHLAGTNGKGSTAAIIESALIEDGKKVGKYTSPHLVRFNERVVVNREEISDENIAIYFEKIETLIKSNNIKATFFEITTAMMFLYFKDMGVEWVVLETGMGGKYDATNIVTPSVVGITNISLDHTDYLGDTIYKIALEKAGIIKKGVKTLLADTQSEVERAVKETTDNFINVINESSYRVELDSDKFLTNIYFNNRKYELPLYGKFQGENFLLAYYILKEIEVEDDIIEKSLKKVVWSGRFEIYSREPLIIFDGAHNVDSAKRLVEGVSESYKKDEVILLTSILEDKDIDNILKTFSGLTNKVVFTGLENYSRGMNAKKMFNRGKRYFLEPEYVDDSMDALERVISYNKKVTIVAGSLYLIGELKKGGECEGKKG